jgi:hypothetical protein
MLSSFKDSSIAKTALAFAVSEVQLASWDRCYDFKNIFAEKIGEKIAFLTQNKAKLWKF